MRVFGLSEASERTAHERLASTTERESMVPSKVDYHVDYQAPVYAISVALAVDEPPICIESHEKNGSCRVRIATNILGKRLQRFHSYERTPSKRQTILPQ
jgi:hypothetical protein